MAVKVILLSGLISNVHGPEAPYSLIILLEKIFCWLLKRGRKAVANSAVAWGGAGAAPPPKIKKHLVNTWFKISKSRTVTMLAYCRIRLA